jgi:serine hydrolase
MKRQILFIQGGGAGAHKADGLLVAALRRAVGSAYDLRYPTMPHESDPDYQRWRTSIGKELAALADGAIIIGHSLGASFLLKYFSEEKVGKIIAGLFLIATPYWGARGWRYEGYERVALREDFAAKLPRGTPVFLYHGRDDEIVPFAHLALYAEKLPQAVVRELDGCGHQLNNDLSEVAADIKRRTVTYLGPASRCELR